MGEMITFKSNGGTCAGYLAGSSGPGVLVIQEYWGLNDHIKDVTDRVAAAGFIALAPDLYHGKVATNDEEAGKIMGALDFGRAVGEIGAAMQWLKTQPRSNGKVAVVGFCWGGTIAWLSACEVSGLAAAVGYYGGGISKALDKQPKVPVLLQFGEKDTGIPLDSVKAISAAHPEVEINTYDAGHGFNCDARAAFDETAAALAMQRTLAFLAQHLR